MGCMRFRHVDGIAFDSAAPRSRLRQGFGVASRVGSSTLLRMTRNRLFADDGDGDAAMVGGAAMFEEENALPGAELDSTGNDRDCFAGPG